ncbi:presenilin-like protein At2g29900 [Macadamia integrifolia]|uniref:presenilin-like protein At2g29900 n=1 Tax=Macadamia integrifolia TaxID=60698 RepID=UPI001C4FC93C|nr:presenilin-like protein At2g29900 [Macadamia integrifolia]
MAQNTKPPSILETIGEEIIRIVTPVSICMFLVVLLVAILNTDTSDSSSSITTMATIAYNEDPSDSLWDKIKGALLNSLVFVVIVTVTTFLLVLLFYFRCIKFLKFYMGFSAFIVLGFLGGEVALFLIEMYTFPIDCITFLVLLFNFTVVGGMSVLMSNLPILINQGYLVVIGMLVAYWFTLLPEWTTWVLLVAMALYDLAAVLLPGGPLRLLVELAIERDEDIPALVYEARPVTHDESALRQRRLWRLRRSVDSGSAENMNSESNSSSNANTVSNSMNCQNETRLVVAEEGQRRESVSELAVPLIPPPSQSTRDGQEVISSENLHLEGIGLGSSGAIKLGLGDFIFYSVLVGRAAMYDFMTVYACYLAIIAGLGITLMLLALYQKALPALPVSILLGVLFYFLTRMLLEAFVVQCSVNLIMF